MSGTQLGINGFGRIGRCVFRQVLEDPRLGVVGVNDLAAGGDLAYLLRHDSVHGPFPGKAEVGNDSLPIEGAHVPFYAHEEPGSIPWKELGADVVIESTADFAAHAGERGLS